MQERLLALEREKHQLVKKLNDVGGPGDKQGKANAPAPPSGLEETLRADLHTQVGAGGG